MKVEMPVDSGEARGLGGDGDAGARVPGVEVVRQP